MSYRDNCGICGESYDDENLMECATCGMSFCYRCGDSAGRRCVRCQRADEEKKFPAAAEAPIAPGRDAAQTDT